jgi:uncharacterized RDD family membrane protein YckC
LGAILLDGLLLIVPVLFLHWRIPNPGRTASIATQLGTWSFLVFFHVYCVGRWGGSPGKLLMGLRIVRADLSPAGWLEAWRREAPGLAVSLISNAVYVYSLLHIPASVYDHLTVAERLEMTAAAGGIAHRASTWLSYVWILSELVVLLTNRRRRALHDFVAGTVVVQTEREPS